MEGQIKRDEKERGMWDDMGAMEGKRVQEENGGRERERWCKGKMEGERVSSVTTHRNMTQKNGSTLGLGLFRLCFSSSCYALPPPPVVTVI